MPTLNAVKSWTEELWTVPGWEGERDNIIGYINEVCVTSPLSRALDMNNQLLLNPRFRGIWDEVNASEYDSIQDAIDDITAGIVRLPANTTWTLTDDQAITLKSGVYLVGGGWSTVLEKDVSWHGTSSPASRTFIDIPNNSTDCGVLNLKIDGQNIANSDGGAPAAGINCIRVGGGSKQMYSHLWIYDWGNTSDGIDARNDGILLGDDAGNGGGNLADSWVLFNRFEDIQRNGASIIDGQGLFLIGNHAIDCRNAGLDLEPNSTSQYLKDCTVTHNVIITAGVIGIAHDGHNVRSAAGTPASNASGNKVSYNTVRDCGNHGIAVIGMYRDEVSHNRIDSVAQTGDAHGIQIRDCFGCQFDNNIISNVGTAGTEDSDGINVGGNNAANEECIELQVNDNFMENIARHGVSVSPGAGTTTEDVSVQDNRIRNYNLHDTSGGGTGTGSGILAGTGINHLTANGNTMRSNARAPYAALYFPAIIGNAVVIGNKAGSTNPWSNAGATAVYAPAGLPTNYADGDQTAPRESNLWI